MKTPQLPGRWTLNAKAEKPTYTARIIDSTNPVDIGKVIYEHRPNGNLIGELLIGSRPNPEDCGTLDRTDGGDPFECARFRAPSGRVQEITRDS